MARRFVLLDRDGTLNVERHYLADPRDLELLPGTVDGLRLLRDMGLGLVVLTNQSGIGRGYFTQNDLQAVHLRLRYLLGEANIQLNGIYHCPHAPHERCLCRKPLPGLALTAAAELYFDPSQSFVIGDKRADVDLGRNLGATSILVRTGHGEETLRSGPVPADHVAQDLLDAANWISGVI